MNPTKAAPTTLDEISALSDDEIEQIIIENSSNKEERTRSMIETSRLCNEDRPGCFRRFHEKLAAAHLGIAVSWRDEVSSE